MTQIIAWPEIERVLPEIDVIGEIERGFAAYTRGEVDVPPVGELLFERPTGELHIKYGTIRGDDVCVIKIATGFYANSALSLPPFNGLNIVVSAKTGAPLAVLLDGGHLTNARTAAAGAVAARHLAPRDVTAIGVLGTGVQARLQPIELKRITPCRRIMLWGRDRSRALACAHDLELAGFRVAVVATPRDVAQAANLIVTVTAADTPLLSFADLRPGTHITAVGSDTPHKQELDADILARADLVVADSLAQCVVRGEIRHAVKRGLLDPSHIVELGSVIAGDVPRPAAGGITVADLTGVAVQDIAICKAVLARLGPTLS